MHSHWLAWLSWFLATYRDSQIIRHSGSDLGYRSSFTLIPSRKIGIVLLSNYDEAPVGAINFKVMDILMDSILK